MDPDGRNPWEIVSKTILTFSIKKDISNSIAEKKLAESKALSLEIGGWHNGKADAWRHASWSKESSETIGKTWTALFGIAHEFENLLEGSPIEQVIMDLTNNLKGREVAGTDTDLKSMAEDNKLMTLTPENPHGYKYSESRGFDDPDAERIRKDMYDNE